MAALTDAELYGRGRRTLVASWEEYARGAPGGSVHREPGVVVAVFPGEPERTVFNNAVPDRGLPAAGRADAIDATQAAYQAAGIWRYAVWVHESDEPLRADLERRGYTIDLATRAMGMTLDSIRLPPPRVELTAGDWLEYLRLAGMPPGFLSGADPAAYHILIARRHGENAATAMAFDHDGDCGIYNVTTLEHARRRGLGTALTVLHLHDALARGCRTATLQSTPMAERVYAAAGFRDLGRILEYAPAGP